MSGIESCKHAPCVFVIKTSLVLLVLVISERLNYTDVWASAATKFLFFQLRCHVFGPFKYQLRRFLIFSHLPSSLRVQSLHSKHLFRNKFCFHRYSQLFWQLLYGITNSSDARAISFLFVYYCDLL